MISATTRCSPDRSKRESRRRPGLVVRQILVSSFARLLTDVVVAAISNRENCTRPRVGGDMFLHSCGQESRCTTPNQRCASKFSAAPAANLIRSAQEGYKPAPKLLRTEQMFGIQWPLQNHDLLTAEPALSVGGMELDSRPLGGQVAGPRKLMLSDLADASAHANNGAVMKAFAWGDEARYQLVKNLSAP